ncbi:hypothetical protein [Streptomyces sp. NPDC047981]|uniref:hypothetical protein n=1 Tax=Streptomyces sp. NPDC047981 TaxID=3154610 RepID=UPI0034421096
MAQKLTDDRIWETGETPFSACKWDEWKRGGTWVARENEDFACSIEVFMDELDHRAQVAGLDVDMMGEEATVYFRFTGQADAGKEKPTTLSLDFSKVA